MKNISLLGTSVLIHWVYATGLFEGEQIDVYSVSECKYTMLVTFNQGKDCSLKSIFLYPLVPHQPVESVMFKK